VCATTDTITVVTGTQVYYCFKTENVDVVTHTIQNLVDDHLGTILDEVYTLAPGQTLQLIVADTVTGPVVNTAMWTAVDGSGSSADSATVNVSDP
jgi:mannose/fructose-specific phosphotransferase system component IIA